MSKEHELYNKILQRLSLIEFRMDQISRYIDGSEASLVMQRQRKMECFECGREVDDVESCADELCPMGLFTCSEAK